MDETREAVRLELSQAIASLAKRAQPSIATEERPRSHAGIPTTDWDAKASFDHRLGGIAADARRIRELATAMNWRGIGR